MLKFSFHYIPLFTVLKFSFHYIPLYNAKMYISFTFSDAAYLDNRSYEVMQVTAWIPLLDATRENGCMEVAARGHLKGKVASHTCCWRDTWYVMLAEDEMVKTLGTSSAPT